jgi:hypothetical protein
MRSRSRRGGVRVAGVLAVGLVACAAFCTCRAQSSDCRIGVEISGNHGHDVVVPAAVMTSDGLSTLGVEGGTHRHVVVVQQVDIATLKGHHPVRTRTSSVQGHGHEVELRCLE